VKKHIVWLIALACIAAASLPPAAGAAARMWVGFQDEQSLLWKPDRERMRARTADAGTTMMRVQVLWYVIAPRRPANAASPSDPGYDWAPFDEMIRQAQRQGQEVMLQIWGTPSWAGAGHNRLPRNLNDLRSFGRALASRYSGRYPQLPFVRFYGVWNEPNLSLFLRPQFDARGRSVSPRLYARLYRAAYAGIKAGNPRALIGIGETSPRGRDRPRPNVSDTHSPAKFAELLSKERPVLRFDAWAHHPYPLSPRSSPAQVVRWPSVTLRSLPRFGRSLDLWFKRRNIPIWVTEYSHETRPEDRNGVTHEQQAAFMQQAVGIARANPRVAMFVWYVLRDDLADRWQSGMLTFGGLEKPAFDRFSVLARLLDARNGIVRVRGGVANPSLRFSGLAMAHLSGVGGEVGITYRVYRGTSPTPATLIAVRQPESRIDVDGWVTVRAEFTPARSRTYTVTIEANNPSGIRVQRTLTVIGT
jgi:hypothetical protein